MNGEGHSGVTINNGVVQFDAVIDQLVRVVPTLAISLPHLRVEKSRVLWSVNLYVGAAQTNQFLYLTSREVHNVGQVGIAGRIRRSRFLGVVVGRRLLGTDHGHFSRSRFT